MSDVAVRVPASSANLGAGFDVLAMAVGLYADLGTGRAPDGAQQLDEDRSGRAAFERLGGTGSIWMRCAIPMARGLGFSGAIRVGAAALAVAQAGGTFEDRADDILAVAAELEGHGDNAAASLLGGVVAYVEGRAVPFVMGPTLAAASFVAWIPDVTTSTNRSRRALGPEIARADAVHNIGRATQLALAFAHDDPALLVGATDDRLHQDVRLPLVPGAADAIRAGVDAGAWCAWLSGSGPTVGMLADSSVADAVAEALPTGGHTKVLSIDTAGVHIL
ncbi:homoserine kinase [Ilumatobacter nonamiensis]|uniref:homoserine kinase n=1 Tax=Ilumatobacter nonamiensis TaxID=467093 RepID=UPI0003472AF0|nr:hypothetical protein [Ilumatobacter nonamiensis]